MSVDVLSVAQKKQAIAKGLSRFVQGNVLEQIVQYWEQRYGNQPSFVLNRFLQDICTTDVLKQQRKEMLRELLFEIAEVEKQVRLQGKSPAEQGQTKHETLVSGYLTDAFIQFIQQVVHTVTDVDRAEFDAEVKAQLRLLKLSVDPLQRVDALDFLEFVPLSNYAKVITALYEVYCEFYGPAKADQIYARTRLQVKNTFPDVDLHQLL